MSALGFCLFSAPHCASTSASSSFGASFCTRSPCSSPPTRSCPAGPSTRLPPPRAYTNVAPSKRRARRRSSKGLESPEDDDFDFGGPTGPGGGSGSGGWGSGGGGGGFGLPEEEGNNRHSQWNNSLNVQALFYEISWLWAVVTGLSFAQALYFVFAGFKKACSVR